MSKPKAISIPPAMVAIVAEILDAVPSCGVDPHDSTAAVGSLLYSRSRTVQLRGLDSWTGTDSRPIGSATDKREVLVRLAATAVAALQAMDRGSEGNQP